MANYVTAIKTKYGDTKIDYNYLANLPSIGGQTLQGNMQLDLNTIGAAHKDHDHDKVYSKTGHNHDDYASKSVATESAAGLMSAEDKKKLNGLSSGGGSANITIDSELSDSSKNPVENVVIKKKFDNMKEYVDDIKDYLQNHIDRSEDSFGFLAETIDNLGIASGTWTPRFVEATVTTAASGTYGYYTKIGKTVILTFNIRMDAENSKTNIGQTIKLSGLPFKAVTNAAGGGICSAGGLADNNYSFSGFFVSMNSQTIEPRKNNAIGALATVAFGDVETSLYGSIVYQTE